MIMKANKSCEDIYSYLKPLSFEVEKYMIIINPIGYTYTVNET